MCCRVVLVGGGVVKVFEAELAKLGFSHQHYLTSFVAFGDHDVFSDFNVVIASQSVRVVFLHVFSRSCVRTVVVSPFESRRVGLGTTVEYIERKFMTKA